MIARAWTVSYPGCMWQVCEGRQQVVPCCQCALESLLCLAHGACAYTKVLQQVAGSQQFRFQGALHLLYQHHLQQVCALINRACAHTYMARAFKC
jgi:hypothetical protein